MKKITLLLLMLISGTVFGQTAQATATADIVSPLVINKTADLNFGKVSNATTGTVNIAPDGTPGGLAQVGTTNPTAAEFEVTAASGYAYTVTLPTSVTLNSGTNTITVDTFTADDANPTGTGTVQTVKVGATLKVTGGQATGNYTGTFDVSVAYD